MAHKADFHIQLRQEQNASQTKILLLSQTELLLSKKNSPCIWRYANQGFERVLEVQLYNKEENIGYTWGINVNNQTFIIHLMSILTSPCFNFVFFQFIYLNLKYYKKRQKLTTTLREKSRWAFESKRLEHFQQLNSIQHAYVNSDLQIKIKICYT